MQGEEGSSNDSASVNTLIPPPPAPKFQQPTLQELEVAELESLIRFVAARDASLLHRAFANADLPEEDHDLVVDIVCSRTKLQLQMLSEAFKAEFGASLRDAISRRRSGSHVAFLNYCCISRAQFLAAVLEEALSSSRGCDIGTINEIFCLNINRDLKAMMSQFDSKSDKTVLEELDTRLTGPHRYLITSIARNGHCSGSVDHDMLESDLETLTSTDTQVVAELFARSSRDHIEALKVMWNNRYPKIALDSTLRRNVEPSVGAACSLLLTNPVDIYALKLKRELNSDEVDTVTVSRTLGGLDKFLAHAVFERYRELYNSDLADLLGNRLEPDLAAAIVLWAHSQDPTGYCFHYPGIPAGVVVSAIDNIKTYVAEIDATMLKHALKPTGIDKKLVITTLCARSKQQLARIDIAYLKKYSMSLRDYVRHNLHAIADFLDFLVMSDADSDAHVLINNLSEDVSDEDLILEILCLRPPHRFAYAKSFYERLSGCSLLTEFAEKFGEDFAKVCEKLINGTRNVSVPIDPAQIAQALHERGFGKDLVVVLNVFAKYNFKQLNEIASAYEFAYNQPLLSVIKTYFSGIVRKTLIYLLCDPVDLFCKKLKDAINAPDVKRDVINRIIGGTEKSIIRSALAAKYEEKYGVSIVDTMFDKLRGDYRSVVVSYITSSDITDGLELKRLNEIKRTGISSSIVQRPPSVPRPSSVSSLPSVAPPSPVSKPPPPPPPPKSNNGTASKPPPPPPPPPRPVEEEVPTLAPEGVEEELERLYLGDAAKPELPPIPRPSGFESGDDSVVSAIAAASPAAMFGRPAPAQSKKQNSALFAMLKPQGGGDGDTHDPSWVNLVPSSIGAAQAGSIVMPEPMRGWAFKEGHIFRTWKRRFFVLESNPTSTVLSYYVNEGKPPTDLKGTMTLRTYAVTQLDDTTIHLIGKSDTEKDLKMQFTSSDLLQKWVRVLRIHLEYRTKIDAINGTTGGIHSTQSTAKANNLKGRIVL